MTDKKEAKKANFGMAELEANWVEFAPHDKRIEPIRLLLRLINNEQRSAFARALEKTSRNDQTEILMQLVVDWNLENSEGPIECSAANKKLWGDRLAHLRVELNPILFDEKDITAGEHSFLGSQAVIFAGRAENYLKN